MIKGLLLRTGYLVMLLVYGTEKYQKRWGSEEGKQEAVQINLLLSIVIIFWLLSLLFAFGGMGSAWLWVYVIGVPVLIAIAAVLVRKKG